MKKCLKKSGLRFFLLRMTLAFVGLAFLTLFLAGFKEASSFSALEARFLRVDFRPASRENPKDSGTYYLSFDNAVTAEMVNQTELPVAYLDILGASLEVNPFLLNFPQGPVKMIRLNQISESPRVIRATFFLRKKFSSNIRLLKAGVEIGFSETASLSKEVRDSYSLIPPLTTQKLPEVKAIAKPVEENLKINVSKGDPVAIIRELARSAGKIVHFRDPMINYVELNISAADQVSAIQKICIALNLKMSEEDGEIWVSRQYNPLLKIPENFRVEGADLSGLALGDVLRALGQIAEINIVLDDSLELLQGRNVQMYLQKMSVRRAIETILQSNNLQMKEIDEKTLMVMTQAKARSFEGKAVRVITPGVPVNTIKNMIEKAVAKEMTERFTISEDLGNLILTGDREAVEEIGVLIKNLDEKFIVAGEGLVREYFQPVNTKTDELIALTKEALSENENIKITHDKRTDMLLLIGAKESVKRAGEIVKRLDKPRTRQALIHIRLVEVHRTELEELGIKLPSTLVSTDDIGRISRENYVIPAELVGTIEKSKIKTLANPTIRCMDKEEALIDISEQIPVKNTVTEYLPVASASLAARTSDNWTTSDIGIKMNVKPTIHVNDEISMDVDIDQTELVSLVEGHPWTAKRQIKTKVRIKDRETVVIGGLIRSKKGNTRKPVPILSRIPLIKNLVRAVEHRNQNDEKTELVVLITPALVEENESEIDRKLVRLDEKK